MRGAWVLDDAAPAFMGAVGKAEFPVCIAVEVKPCSTVEGKYTLNAIPQHYLPGGGWSHTDEKAFAPGQAEGLPLVPCLCKGAYPLGRHGAGAVWYITCP